MSEERHVKPKLIVFDLDYSLWPFYVQKHLVHPLLQNKGEIFDMRLRPVKPYPEVPMILSELNEKGYELAIASRTSEIRGANQLIKLLGWDKYFKYKEIYPTSKLKHFSKFCDASHYKYEEMLFFDDDHRNIQELSEVGVTCVLVPAGEGVTKNLVEAGLELFAQNGYNWYEDY
ncbi:magnesium-dependent phosphatase 1-like [Frankliniella occidentalis]|uniref:Magnesium-dependent phosphatase 1-like n=1 Tax=Frankliniella occidentalis TaxID=133901 RepID=A0A6J1S7R4_FRAOC|nr:magnesium-dependent phosphatase 1-like [Frankliniella occidentalis]